MRDKGRLIVGDELSYSRDSYETQRNNNVMIVGASGTGKSRSYVIPNLLQKCGSYIVSDPKGQLQKNWADYFRDAGYDVKVLDFVNMNRHHYNPLEYVITESDAYHLAYMMTHDGNSTFGNDPFWDDANCMLLSLCMTLVLSHPAFAKKQNMGGIMDLMEMLTPFENNGSLLDNLYSLVMEVQKKYGSSHPAVKKFRRFYAIVGAEKTTANIIMTLNTILEPYTSLSACRMLSRNDVDFKRIGEKKTILFVSISDVDRSMDRLATVFFTQALQQLCRHADSRPDGALRLPVTLICDDFATNLKIPDMPNYISTLRSRNINTMLILQSESQLYHLYGHNATTVVTNCDTYIYLGGSDLNTAESVAKRANVLLPKVLNMEVGTNYIFRRGEQPVHGKSLCLEEWLKKQQNPETHVREIA